MTRAAGIDVGGTKALGVVIGGDGTVLERHRLPTPHGADAIIETLAELAGLLAPTTPSVSACPDSSPGRECCAPHRTSSASENSRSANV
ncbi:MAG: hypothetical protein R2705_20620 [Ilumatobacteraceae bacterium]